MRTSLDPWALSLAMVTAKRSTCLRRAVGCVLLNAKGHVLSTGYNGVARGLPHCNERVMEDPKYRFGDTGLVARAVTWPHACPGADQPSGVGLDGCEAIHAEQNALLQCPDPDAIHTCYVTASPCMTCTKLLMNTSCGRVVFLEPYPHAEAEELWRRVGRQWIRLEAER